MTILKYSLLTILIILVLAMVLVGILSLTRGATVRTVIAEGDRGGPPQVSDPLFPRSIATELRIVNRSSSGVEFRAVT